MMKVQSSIFIMIMLQKGLFCEAEERKHTYGLSLYLLGDVHSQCAITCPLLWRNTAWRTWRRRQSTTSVWRQWREQERGLGLSALSTLCQRTWWVIKHVWSTYKHAGPEHLSPLPPSAAVDPECAVCDVFNLNTVHLHVEAVSDGFGKLQCARSSCIFQISPSFMCPESNKKSFRPCRRPSFQISPIVRGQVRWETNRQVNDEC